MKPFPNICKAEEMWPLSIVFQNKIKNLATKRKS